MKIHKETKVAIFVIIAGTMFYTGFNFLKGIDFFSSTHRYYVNYANVAGLTASNAVIVNGLSVGRVKEVSILEDSAHSLRVAIDVDKSIRITDSSVALIASTDLLGSKALVIQLKGSDKLLEEGGYLIGEVEKGFTDKLAEQAGPMVSNIGTTIDRLNAILSEKNIHTISKTLENVEKTTATLHAMMEANKTNIEGITSNLNKLSASLVQTEKQLKPLLTKANTLADSLNKMQLAAAVESTRKTVDELQKVLEGINKGQGTMGKFVKNDSLYANLNSSARSLDSLLIDLRKHPKRYVHFSLFGKKDK